MSDHPLSKNDGRETCSTQSLDYLLSELYVLFIRPLTDVVLELKESSDGLDIDRILRF